MTRHARFEPLLRYKPRAQFTLALTLLFALSWTAWKVARARRPSSSPSSVAVQAAALPDSTNNVLVIPVVDKSGKTNDPMILVPVNGASTNQARGTNDSQPARARTTAVSTNLSILDLSAIPNFDEKTFLAQIALARRGISSGSLDGILGAQTRAAIRSFQKREGLTTSGLPDDNTLARAQRNSNAPIFTNYIVTSNDFARLLPLGKTWLEKSAQERLDFETILELVAERSHSNPKLVAALNPAVEWNHVEPGTSLKLVAVNYPEPARKAAFIRISIGSRMLEAFDAETNLLAHFPCSIASRVEKRPVGEELHVSVMAPNPNYTFDPDVFPESPEAQQLGRKLILQPGPNNPVGVAWIGLDKPGYGMHGTPRPEDVGRTESHGCFRLANWNAEYLLKLVTVGTPVFVDP